MVVWWLPTRHLAIETIKRTRKSITSCLILLHVAPCNCVACKDLDAAVAAPPAVAAPAATQKTCENLSKLLISVSAAKKDHYFHIIDNVM